MKNQLVTYDDLLPGWAVRATASSLRKKFLKTLIDDLRPAYLRVSCGGVRNADRRAGKDSRTLQGEHDAAFCRIPGKPHRAGDAENRDTLIHVIRRAENKVIVFGSFDFLGSMKTLFESLFCSSVIAQQQCN